MFGIVTVNYYIIVDVFYYSVWFRTVCGVFALHVMKSVLKKIQFFNAGKVLRHPRMHLFSCMS